MDRHITAVQETPRPKSASGEWDTCTAWRYV